MGERGDGHARKPDAEEFGLRRCIESAFTWRLRCVRRRERWDSLAELLPERVSVLPDGTARAHYPKGGGTLYFNDLAHLFAHHRVSMRDFEEDDAPD
jgi:hypothetical protein